MLSLRCENCMTRVVRLCKYIVRESMLHIFKKIKVSLCVWFFFRTYLFKEEKSAPGFKAAKDRLTLLLGGNAEGDVKLKPMLVYTAENPRALKNTHKSTLPVVWRANKSAWVTTSLMYDYIHNYLSPFISRYTAENNLSNKALLIVDNAPGHPHDMTNWCDNIHVVFLPPNTTSLIQPCDQGIIATFKAYYTRRTIKDMIHATDEQEISVREYWKSYNIKKGLDNIAAAWGEVSAVTMNAVWRKLWPEVVHDFCGFSVPAHSALTKEIADLANSAKLGDNEEVLVDDVDELLNSHDTEMTTEELLELEEQRRINNENEQESPVTIPSLSLQDLDAIIKRTNELCDLIFNLDPNAERSFNVRNQLKSNVTCYKELHKQKKALAKQTKVSDFFKRKSSSVSSASTTPSSPIAALFRKAASQHPDPGSPSSSCEPESLSQHTDEKEPGSSPSSSSEPEMC